MIPVIAIFLMTLCACEQWCVYEDNAFEIICNSRRI